MEYAFSTAADVLAFVQFDDESDRADFNLRFHWIPVIGDDVFVVWNSGYTTDPSARFRFPESRIRPAVEWRADREDRAQARAVGEFACHIEAHARL